MITARQACGVYFISASTEDALEMLCSFWIELPCSHGLQRTSVALRLSHLCLTSDCQVYHLPCKPADTLNHTSFV